LNEIDLGASFDLDSGSSSEIAMRVEHLTTDGGDTADTSRSDTTNNCSTDAGSVKDNDGNVISDGCGNLYLEISGLVNTIVPDPTISPALGSYHVDESSIDMPIDTDSSLAFTLNSNTVNQFLLSAYNTGGTHLTMLGITEPTFHTRHHATDDLGVNGDYRIELIPTSPGEFLLEGTLSNQAYIGFRGSKAIISRNDNGTWEETYTLDIDVKAGVEMEVIEGLFAMTLAGTPEYTINSMTDIIVDLGWLTFNIPADLIELMVKMLIEWGAPYVTANNAYIDISQLGISDRLYTESIDTSTGHLIFQTSVDTSIVIPDPTDDPIPDPDIGGVCPDNGDVTIPNGSVIDCCESDFMTSKPACRNAFPELQP